MRTEGEGKVKYNFKAESPRELNLQKVNKTQLERKSLQGYGIQG